MITEVCLGGDDPRRSQFDACTEGNWVAFGGVDDLPRFQRKAREHAEKQGLECVFRVPRVFEGRLLVCFYEDDFE